MPRTKRSKPAPSQRYHNRVARRYDAMYEDAYWRFHDELTWRTVRRYVPADQSAACLDLGCGTGKWGLRLLKTGLATTFVDHSAAMIAQTRQKIEALGPKASRATLLVADIVDLHDLPSEHFALVLAMGDPLSICADPVRAVTEMHRLCRAGGVVVATADNKLAGLDHFAQRGDLDGLEEFVRTGRTHWLTDDRREQFPTQSFTPIAFQRLFERAGFEILQLSGKPIVPVRTNQGLLGSDSAMDRLIRIEEDLSRDAASAGRAAHLQIVART
jgi:SAM-dependent methyltransferase